MVASNVLSTICLFVHNITQKGFLPNFGNIYTMDQIIVDYFWKARIGARIRFWTSAPAACLWCHIGMGMSSAECSLACSGHWPLVID